MPGAALILNAINRAKPLGEPQNQIAVRPVAAPGRISADTGIAAPLFAPWITSPDGRSASSPPATWRALADPGIPVATFGGIAIPFEPIRGRAPAWSFQPPIDEGVPARAFPAAGTGVVAPVEPWRPRPLAWPSQPPAIEGFPGPLFAGAGTGLPVDDALGRAAPRSLRVLTDQLVAALLGPAIDDRLIARGVSQAVAHISPGELVPGIGTAPIYGADTVRGVTTRNAQGPEGALPEVFGVAAGSGIFAQLEPSRPRPAAWGSQPPASEGMPARAFAGVGSGMPESPATLPGLGRPARVLTDQLVAALFSPAVEDEIVRRIGQTLRPPDGSLPAALSARPGLADVPFERPPRAPGRAEGSPTLPGATAQQGSPAIASDGPGRAHGGMAPPADASLPEVFGVAVGAPIVDGAAWRPTPRGQPLSNAEAQAQRIAAILEGEPGRRTAVTARAIDAPLPEPFGVAAGSGILEHPPAIRPPFRARLAVTDHLLTAVLAAIFEDEVTRRVSVAICHGEGALPEIFGVASGTGLFEPTWIPGPPPRSQRILTDHAVTALLAAIRQEEVTRRSIVTIRPQDHSLPEIFGVAVGSGLFEGAPFRPETRQKPRLIDLVVPAIFGPAIFADIAPFAGTPRRQPILDTMLASPFAVSGLPGDLGALRPASATRWAQSGDPTAPPFFSAIQAAEHPRNQQGPRRAADLQLILGAAASALGLADVAAPLRTVAVQGRAWPDLLPSQMAIVLRMVQAEAARPLAAPGRVAEPLAIVKAATAPIPGDSADARPRAVGPALARPFDALPSLRSPALPGAPEPVRRPLIPVAPPAAPLIIEPFATFTPLVHAEPGPRPPAPFRRKELLVDLPVGLVIVELVIIPDWLRLESLELRISRMLGDSEDAIAAELQTAIGVNVSRIITDLSPATVAILNRITKGRS